MESIRIVHHSLQGNGAYIPTENMLLNMVNVFPVFTLCCRPQEEGLFHISGDAPLTPFHRFPYNVHAVGTSQEAAVLHHFCGVFDLPVISSGSWVGITVRKAQNGHAVTASATAIRGDFTDIMQSQQNLLRFSRSSLGI